MSSADNDMERDRDDISEDDRPMQIKRQKKSATALGKKAETCDDSSDDEPLSNKMEECNALVNSGMSYKDLVAKNIAAEEATINDKTIDGKERPVAKNAFTASQVQQARDKRNRAVGPLGSAAPKKNSQREQRKLYIIAMKKRDDKQDEEVRSSSEGELSDDAMYGAVQDSKKLKIHVSASTIHTKPSSDKRVSKSTVKFNPRAGGADTLAKDKTLAGLDIRVSFLGVDALCRKSIYAFLTWRKSDYCEANRNPSGSKYMDGSRHTEYLDYVGWSIHDSAAFLNEFRLILEKISQSTVNPVTALETLKKQMDVHTLFGSDIVVYLNADKKPYPDNFLDIKILQEFEQEEVKEVEEPEGQEKKKRSGKGDSDPHDFVEVESSDSSSGVDSNHSDHASVNSCEDSSDDSDESQDSISGAEQQGIQQDLPDSDSDEVSDEEERADKSDNEESDQNDN